MTTSLAKDLRNTLAKTTTLARVRAESACKAALENLAVHEKEYRPHMTVEQRTLRNQLRARGRALGDRLDKATGTQEIKHLTEAAAYEHWHRLLFTRFLAENNLLHTGAEHGNVPVTLQDCEELAAELGARDGFDLACRFSAEILPGVFRSDDLVLDLRLAVNDEVELRRLLDSLPKAVFTADDSLGWTYQFWQAQRKDEVNRSGKKIGADELPAVTQLFTEDYMVEFLLHNTLGAWWAGKLGPIDADTEEEARVRSALPYKDGLSVNWVYLRFIQDEETKKWTPAVGNFDEWPKEAKEIKFLDPCMGSGHFLVFALPIIARMRMEEQGISVAEAVYATLETNLHGLEIDERCSQIAAFNLALTAWKISGYQRLPILHLACSGLAPNAPEKEWIALAGNDERLKNGISGLYKLFNDAPILGSLINPRAPGMRLLESDFKEVQPLLTKALVNEGGDNTVHEMSVTARGLAKAAEILADQFTLVVTNVPYLGRNKHNEILRNYCERVYPEAKADLAACFIERCLGLCNRHGSTALVTPHSWLFLGTYKHLRKSMLTRTRWNAVSRLGPGAFETIGGEVVNVALIVVSNSTPDPSDTFFSIDASRANSPIMKARELGNRAVQLIVQGKQIANPDYCIQTEERRDDLPLLGDYSSVLQGVGTTDNPRYLYTFWEIPIITNDWDLFQYAPEIDGGFSGFSGILKWQQGQGPLGKIGTAHKGLKAFGKRGFAVSVTSGQKFTRFLGYRFDNTIAVLIPNSADFHDAMGTYLMSPDFKEEVRKLDQAMSVTESSFLKVPFDLAHWQKVAEQKYPGGLPKPFSSDPTQWLFDGRPIDSDHPLQVAVARLLGYRWPRQSGLSFLECPPVEPDGLEPLADADGIVCLPPINKEQPAAQRLRSLLTKALGQFDEKSLVARAGTKGSRTTTLEDWLREEFFEQHCDLFHNRPFVWHIWDGQRDGFHALVNYHKLDHANLQKLTYSYLGDWIRQQDEDAKADKPGAAIRLGAARRLQAELAKILEGEAPYDIFVRWKPIAEQAIGWNPDLNDGVRLNIRPFLTAADVGKKGAGVLRSKPNIKWDKDRGKEPHRDKEEFPWFWCEGEPGTDPVGGQAFTGNRWNNVHLTLANKKRSRNT